MGVIIVEASVVTWVGAYAIFNVGMWKSAGAGWWAASLGRV